MQALPRALAARGHRVMVVAPRYRRYQDAWETGVRLRVRVFDSNQEVRRRKASMSIRGGGLVVNCQ